MLFECKVFVNVELAVPVSGHSLFTCGIFCAVFLAVGSFNSDPTLKLTRVRFLPRVLPLSSASWYVLLDMCVNLASRGDAEADAAHCLNLSLSFLKFIVILGPIVCFHGRCRNKWLSQLVPFLIAMLVFLDKVASNVWAVMSEHDTAYAHQSHVWKQEKKTEVVSCDFAAQKSNLEILHCMSQLQFSTCPILCSTCGTHGTWQLLMHWGT